MTAVAMIVATLRGRRRRLWTVGRSSFVNANVPSLLLSWWNDAVGQCFQ